ncbi:MAG: glucosamine-6-phosphate isomerase [Planctomycetaceae bacterium]
MDLLRLMTIPRATLGQGTIVQVRIGGNAEALARLMAEEIAGLIRENNDADRPTCLIVPVGPVGQYRILARMITEDDLDCSRVTFINMDEFLDDDGGWIDPGHPLSFRGFMDRSFYRWLPPEARFRPESRIFPDPKEPEAIARRIAERGGVDVCFGGIGLNGQLAFNEPEDVGLDEFAARPTRSLAIAPESRAHLAVNLACALDLIPRRAVTIGMREILAARRIRLFADRPWQCGVVRQVLHGPITPLCPASYVQRHPDATLTLADFVAEPREVRLR